MHSNKPWQCRCVVWIRCSGTWVHFRPRPEGSEKPKGQVAPISALWASLLPHSLIKYGFNFINSKKFQKLLEQLDIKFPHRSVLATWERHCRRVLRVWRRAARHLDIGRAFCVGGRRTRHSRRPARSGSTRNRAPSFSNNPIGAGRRVARGRSNCERRSRPKDIWWQGYEKLER